MASQDFDHMGQQLDLLYGGSRSNQASNMPPRSSGGTVQIKSGTYIGPVASFTVAIDPAQVSKMQDEFAKMLKGSMTITFTRSSQQTVSKEDAIVGYHFLPYSRRLSHDDGRLIEQGTIVTVPDAHTCAPGLHASRRIIDAFYYTESTILSKVRCWGTYEETTGKFAATNRECLWVRDIDTELYQVANELAAQEIAKLPEVAGVIVRGLKLKADHLAATMTFEPVGDIENAIREYVAAYQPFKGINWFKGYMSLHSFKSLGAVLGFSVPSTELMAQADARLEELIGDAQY